MDETSMSRMENMVVYGTSCSDKIACLSTSRLPTYTLSLHEKSIACSRSFYNSMGGVIGIGSLIA
jgi:hypothetical protein